MLIGRTPFTYSINPILSIQSYGKYFPPGKIGFPLVSVKNSQLIAFEARIKIFLQASYPPILIWVIIVVFNTEVVKFMMMFGPFITKLEIWGVPSR